MSSDSSPLTGYGHLWDRLVERARLELRQQSTAAAAEIEQISPEAIADEEQVQRFVEAGIEIARRHDLTLPSRTRRALEKGVSAFASLGKLKRINRRIAELRAAGEAVDPSEADAVLDLWWTYIYRHLDTTAAFLEEAGSVLVSDGPALDEFLADVQEWRADRKKDLAQGRQEVAHGNSVYVRAIDEDGLWEPMILSGFARMEAVEQMVAPQSEAMNRRLALWGEGLKDVTATAIAEGDSLCNRLTSFPAG